eukprot:Sro485_g152350.2  (820) ;mRNA; f:9621-12080
MEDDNGISKPTPSPRVVEEAKGDVHDDGPREVPDQSTHGAFSVGSNVDGATTAKLQRGLHQDRPQTTIAEKEARLLPHPRQTYQYLNSSTASPTKKTKTPKGLRKEPPRSSTLACATTLPSVGYKGLRQPRAPTDKFDASNSLASNAVATEEDEVHVTPNTMGGSGGDNGSPTLVVDPDDPEGGGNDENITGFMATAHLVEEVEQQQQGSAPIEARPIRRWDYLRNRTVLTVITFLIVAMVAVVIALVVVRQSRNLDLVISGLPDYTIDSLRDPASHQGQAHEWLKGHPDIENMPEWRKIQLFSMAVFFYATKGQHWRRKENWLSYDAHECRWQQYYPENQFSLSNCNDEGALQRLHLDYWNLKGTIPRELSLLGSLKIIYLHENRLFSSIPSDIGRISSLLGLALQNNELSGSIPTEIGSLPQLLYLRMEKNQLSGTLPRNIGSLSHLQLLQISDNLLGGNIPSHLQHLTSLETLLLNDNILSGPLPTELGLLRAITELDLSGNLLGSTIFTELGGLQRLTDLDLSSTLLNGTLPSEIGKLSWLVQLDLTGNNHLTGTLPEQIGMLARLRSFNLSNHGFTGSIPSTIGLLSRVSSLDLSSNRFSGSLPSEIGRVGIFDRGLFYLLLGGNSLVNRIPSELGKLTDLHTLELSWNNFSKNIPHEIGALTGLKSLDLQDHSLTGRIPSTIGLCESLEDLILTGNSLAGPLPSELGVLGKMRTLYLSRNRNLSGTVPTELNQAANLRHISLHDTQLSGTIPFCPSRRRLATASESLPEYPDDDGLHYVVLPELPYLYAFVQVDCQRVSCNCSSCFCVPDSGF